MPGGNIPKGSTESNFQDVLTCWAIRGGWRTEARNIEETRWMRVCGRQRRQFDALGLEWDEAGPMKETGLTNTREVEIVENEAIALVL